MATVWPLGHAYVDCHRLCGRCHHYDAGAAAQCERPEAEHAPNGTPLRDALIVASPMRDAIAGLVEHCDHKRGRCALGGTQPIRLDPEDPTFQVPCDRCGAPTPVSRDGAARYVTDGAETWCRDCIREWLEEQS